MATTTITLEDQIRSTYEMLAETTGQWISLVDIREYIGGDDLNRADVDQALRLMDRTPEVTIIPEANRKTLRPKDHAAAVVIGGEANHLIAIH